MKTISSRFLKGGLAVLLAVIMLFSSTLTGFAAVIENAETSAQYNLNWKGKVFFLVPEKWDISTYSTIQVDITRTTSSSDSKYQYYAGNMTRVGSTRLYYLNLSADHSSWKQNEYIAFTANSSTYGSGTFTLNTNKYYTTPIDYGCNNSSNFYIFKPSSSSDFTSTTNGNDMSANWDSTNTIAAATQTAQIYTDGSSSATGGKVSYSGLNFSSTSDTTGTTSKNGTSTSASVSLSNAVLGSSMSFTATPNSGYKFDGWYSAATGGTLLSSNATYSYNVYEAKTVYARFSANGYSYSVVAGTGGKITSTPTSGIGTSVQITAEADTGYHFTGWTVTGGSVEDEDSASTTFTIESDGAKATANFAKNTYTVTYYNHDSSVYQTLSDVEHGSTITALEGPARDHYTFDKWTTNADGTGTEYATDATITVNDDFNLYPQYTPDGHTVDVTIDPTDGGSVTVNDGADYTDIAVHYGDEVTVKATSKTGYTFEGWYNGATRVSTDDTYTFTVDGDVELKAKFVLKNYTITVDTTAGGKATVNGGSTANILHGDTVTLVATADDGYRFHSWQLNGREVSFEAEFEVAPEASVTYTATFVKTWNVSAKFPEGVSAVKVDETETAILYSSNPDAFFTVNSGTKYTPTVVLTDSDKYELIGWKITKGTETKIYNTESVEVTYDNITVLEPIIAKLYNVTAADAKDGTGYYVPGKTVTLLIDVPDGKYISAVSVTGSVTGGVDATVNVADGIVTFEMPADDVNVTIEYGNKLAVTFEPADIIASSTSKGSYVPGQLVAFKVTPKSGRRITGVTSEQTPVSFDNNTITFQMPDKAVVLNFTYEESFKANSEVITVHIDKDVSGTNYNSNEAGGTVTMTCNGQTLAEGATADGDVTYTAKVASNSYEFVGFYSDADCKQLITTDLTTTVVPDSDITVYALFARKQYIKIGNNSYYQMKFDPELLAYTMVYTNKGAPGVGTAPIGTTFNTEFNISVSYRNSGDHEYKGFGNSGFIVTFNENGLGRTVGWGKDVWRVGGKQTNTELPLTIIIKPKSVRDHYNIDVSARAVKIGSTMYLSSGRLDLPGSYNASVFNAESTFVDMTNPANVDVKHYQNKVAMLRERYKQVNITEDKTVTFSTKISGTAAGNYYIDKYVIYFIETETFEVIKPMSKGENTYEGSVFVDGDCYIVPIYMLTPEYAAEHDLTEIDIYFDATAIKGLSWGPFVACYAWGTNNAEYQGGWSGQMMIPTDDGLSYYAMITVPKADAENPPSYPTGITFNNYLHATTPGNNLTDAFGITSTVYQTYDYREPITLYENGYEVITFVAKASKDGYHGDHANGVQVNKVEAKNYPNIATDFTFDYLYCRDGVTPMDLNGEAIVGVDTSILSADYYIVAKGDITYNKAKVNTQKYDGDNNYSAIWSVDWYVFNSNGDYLKHVMSDAFYNDKDGNGTSLLLEKLGLTTEQVAGKRVAISYEAPNNCPKEQKYSNEHQISYDGQWYGNMLDHTIRGDVVVGYVDVNSNKIVLEKDDTLNIGNITGSETEIYGEGYVIGEEGNRHQALDITLEIGEISLTASAHTGYRFIGWHTLQPDGTYKLVEEGYSYTTYLDNNKTFYAIFKEIQEGELIINHAKYSNTDPAIPDHKGVAEMYIEIIDKDGKVVKSTPSTSLSTISVPAKDGDIFKIRIHTKPLMNGEFYAWYTDSLKADGTKTFEEVFTDENNVGSTTPIYAEFEFKYIKGETPNILNFYSDIMRISNYADIRFQYTNRFGQTRYYVVKDVLLTDEECTDKFEGNNYVAYTPAFLTLYTLTNYSTNHTLENVYLTQKELKEYSDQGYDVVFSFNKLTQYAPNANVTEVYDGTVVWDIIDTQITAEKSIVTIKAIQGDPEYTVNYKMAGQQGSIKGEYNVLVQDLIAPAKYDNKDFSYWMNSDTGDILTYTLHYNFRITENKNIEAVYGKEVKPWAPSIESVTYTREYGQGGDYIYTDYLLSFASKDGLEIEDLKASGADVKYGMLVFRDSAYWYDGEGDITYPAITAELEGKYPAILKAAKNVGVGLENNTKKYNCYYYDLTNKTTLTNFNRTDYYLQYDNKLKVDTDHYFREYAFTAVAFLEVNGKQYFSNPVNVNFFDLATTNTTKN